MQTLTLAMLIICCSESLWITAFFTTVDRIKGYWQNVNLRGLQCVTLKTVINQYYLGQKLTVHGFVLCC